MVAHRPKVVGLRGMFLRFASCFFASLLLLLPIAAAADQHEAKSVQTDGRADGHRTPPGHDESPSTFTSPQDGNRPSDVLFAVYFIPLDDNERKSLDWYVEALPRTCSFLEQFGHGIAAVGNHSFVRSIPGCETLEPEGPEYALDDLRHADAASLPSQLSCFFHPGKPMDHRIIQIWLNKIELLCDLGDRYPDRRIILVDAGLNHVRRPFVQPMLDYFEGNKHEPDDTLTMSMYQPSWIKRGRKMAWGQRGCRGVPLLVASILSIRGGYSQRLREIYREAIRDTSHLAVQANATGEGCPCYTEEDVITQMYKQHPSEFTVAETIEDRRKDLTPGAIRAPGDHPPFFEWLETKRRKEERKKRPRQQGDEL